MTAVGLPGLATLAIGDLAFLIALIAARTRRDRRGEAGSRRSSRSIAGIALQGAGFVAVGVGPVDVSLDPLGAPALTHAGAIAILLAMAVGLFVGATRAMGTNWSLVARTRDDHRLVTAGPFAYIRHPIYAALFLNLLALAIGLGHPRGLIPGALLFGVGTWLRVIEEERLLRLAFGQAYEDYASGVKRFVPGVF